MENRVEVRIDDRARLLSALLAGTSWPDDEQRRKPHGTHAHARSTRKLLQGHDKHPAVLIMQALLDRGVPLAGVYEYIMALSWPGLASAQETPPWVPPTWPRHLLNLYEKAKLAQWWAEEDGVWDASRKESEKMFAGADFYSFLRQFVGEFSEQMVFMPNVSYPTDQEVGVGVDGTLFCLAPPRIAWGDNPPWPFDEDPTHIYRAALTQFGRVLMRRYLQAHPDALEKAAKAKLPVPKAFQDANTTWEDQFLALFATGIVAIYLADAVNEQEAKAYVLFEKKAQGVDVLPGVVSVLRRYLNGFAEGQYANFAEYLPYFGKHLRVAKTITAL